MAEQRSETALPPHDHAIEPGEINRRGCERCEIERQKRIEAARYQGTSWDREWQERGKDHP